MAEASGMSEVCKGSESCSQDMEGSETSEDNCNGKPKIKCEVTYDEAVVVLDSNVLGHDTGIKTTPSFSLRTSKLNPFSSSGLPSTPNSKPFVLNPPKLSNPFVKTEKEPESRESICSTPKTPVNEERASTSLNLSKSGVSFLPLGGEATTPSQPSSFTAASTPSLGFVFGQNIHEKVEAATPAESSSVAAAEPSPSKDTQEVTTNGTSSEILFQAPKENTEKTSEGSKSLSEAAREYEEARAVKRKYDEVPVLTGEEEEANVLQINCKLFSWSSCSWTERGRGTLRVNDLPTSPGSHRLIVRTAGSLRVVLNTKIWSGMTVDRASSKSLRITGMDSNGVVKVFLVMASPKEMDQLQKCLEWRVNNLKKSEESSPKKIRQEDS